MKLLRTFSIFMLFFTTMANAQLAGFNLEVTKTDETCLGNGSITFVTTNLTPLSSLLFKVYRLPNTTNAISILTDNHLAGLTAGNYKVVALQALGSQSNAQEKLVTIANNIQPFNFTLTSANQNCATGGNIQVNVTSGIAATYQIISGPVTRPLQPSNVFENLPAGTYNIRAFNNCGLGKVKTFTLSIVNSVLEVSDSTVSDTPQCDVMTVSNTVTASSGTIGYPVNVQYTLDVMDISGNAVVINQTHTTGDPSALTLSTPMPRPMSQGYSYDLKVTDNCGTLYQKNEIAVDPNIKLQLDKSPAPCGEKFLTINASMHSAPFYVTFLNAPAGFNPADFNPTPNAGFPGNTVSFGDMENPVPFGTYEVQITDSCGRSTSQSILIELEKPIASVKGINNGCFSEFGKIRVTIPAQKVVTISIIAAPSTYTQPLPRDYTSGISANGSITINNLPLGMYTVIFTDDCGNSYEKEVEVPAFVEKNFTITTLPGCEAGFGAVSMSSGNGKLTSAVITGTTAAFGQALPYNVTANIDAEGDFYINNLPEGTYAFTATDVCGIVKQMSINVEGYRPAQNNYVFTPNCGSFSVKVTDTSNGTEGVSYWLQKFNVTAGTWGHPGTGLAYTEGSEPTATTGVRLSNNALRNNLNYSGKFRIIKKFESFGNGTADNSICIKLLGEFNYTDGLSISNAYSLACVGNPGDVYLETTGYPTAFRIIKKNGAPFVVENGTNNVFTNLTPAEYVFEVEDACGNRVPKVFNVQVLPSIADASDPNDMLKCTATGSGQTEVFHLTDQNDHVLGLLHSALYTITYHLTQADADNGVNPLPEFYTNTSNGQTIYARLIHNEIAICHGTTSFQLFVGGTPEPTITTTGYICDGNKLQLTANAGYNSYLWSTGETTRTIFVDEPGMYTVIVEKDYGNQICDGFAEVEVKASFAPTGIRVDTSDWTKDQNSISVYAQGDGEYEYSIDGINYQESNVFEGLLPGVYTVHVKDANGCGNLTQEVVLMHYPNYFTPNGDGVHDKWQIKYSVAEPNMNVMIYDRFGKIVGSFGSTSAGWDGTFNGTPLPSTDYWFVVTRQDGREFKGHFAMIR
ncbi:MAG: T9SS type B sorting domain-containing protein [Flavobacterium sp.]|nr:MAG: T9SS type B sorting domain-containing protein [Flavobacterium sp.]